MKNYNELKLKKKSLKDLMKSKGLNLNTKKIILTTKLLKDIKKNNSYNPLKTEEQNNIQFLSELNSYKGSRHNLNLPVRGQRSRTNAKTAKKRKNSKNKN
jgi:small subunit ribosomal protein S13